MIDIALMTHFNSSSEVVSHPDALFLRYGTNFLIDGHFDVCLLTLYLEICEPNDKFGFSRDNCCS